MIYLTAEQVLFIHSRLITETGGSHGIRDLNMLESAISRPKASFDDQDLYQDIFLKAAALMDSLINNHPFLDGNKRTGITSAGLFLKMNGWKLEVSMKNLERITLDTAMGKICVEDLAKWFQEHSHRANG